jgi:hypothetical protein
VVKAVRRPGAVPHPRVARRSDTSLRVRWGKAARAKGYVVYRRDKKTRAYERVAVVTGARSWVDRGLPERTAQAYRVRAFTKGRGNRILGEATYTVTARTYRRGDKKVNAGKLTGETDIEAGLWAASFVNTLAEVGPSDFGTAAGKYPMSRQLRVFTDNPSVARVMPHRISGFLLRVCGWGTATVRVVAHNGNMLRLRIRVKDFSHPAGGVRFGSMYAEFRFMWPDLGARIMDLTRRLTESRSLSVKRGATLSLDEDGALVGAAGFDPGPDRAALMALLEDSPYPMEVQISDDRGFISFLITTIDPETGQAHPVTNNVYEELRFYYGGIGPDTSHDIWAFTYLAPHWYWGTTPDF